MHSEAVIQASADKTHIEDGDLHRNDSSDLVLGRSIVGFAELHDVDSLRGHDKDLMNENSLRLRLVAGI